jgi:hypothetical protein
MSMLDMQASPEFFEAILDQLDLVELNDWVYLHNPSVYAPYHGAQHETLMTCYAYLACQHEGLLISEHRLVIAAACMHDFNHSGADLHPNLDDSHNIERALAGLAKLRGTEPELFFSREWQEISRLIACTRYPYLAEPADLLEKIMRDADMSMPYVDSPLCEKLFLGLRQELAAAGKVYTLDEFANGVIDFYQAGTKHTTWAVNYAKRHNLTRKLEELCATLKDAECRSSTEGG